jgi:hypothetical protein
VPMVTQRIIGRAVLVTALLLFAGVSPADPVLLTGWPTSPEQVSNYHKRCVGIRLCDLDGDGDVEVLYARVPLTIGGGSLIHVWHHDGMEAAGWPVGIPYFQVQPLSCGDLDSDGQVDVVGCAAPDFGLTEGQLWARRYDGSLMPGFPIALWKSVSSPVLVDLDLDGDLEIVLVDSRRDSVPARVLAFHHDGGPVSGWPVALWSPDTLSIEHDPAVGEFDGDAFPEIVVCGIRRVYMFNHDGTPVPGWPFDIDPTFFGNHDPGTTIGDIDFDGWPEVAFVTLVESAFGPTTLVTVLEHDGTIKAGWPVSSQWTHSPVGMADFASGAGVELLFTDLEIMYAFHCDGTPVSGWPFDPSPHGDQSEQEQVVADVNSDGPVEWVKGLNYADVGILHPHAYDSAHVEPPGFPLPLQRSTDGPMTPGVGDIDANGSLDLVFAIDSFSFIDTTSWMRVYAYDLGVPDTVRIEWSQHGNGPHNWHNYDWYDPPTFVHDYSTPSVPASFNLFVHPNPFNPVATVSFNLPRDSHVRIEALDVLGRRAALILEEDRPTGSHAIRWDASGLPSGTYFLRLHTDTFSRTVKATLIK